MWVCATWNEWGSLKGKRSVQQFCIQQVTYRVADLTANETPQCQDKLSLGLAARYDSKRSRSAKITGLPIYGVYVMQYSWSQAYCFEVPLNEKFLSLKSVFTTCLSPLSLKANSSPPITTKSKEKHFYSVIRWGPLLPHWHIFLNVAPP